EISYVDWFALFFLYLIGCLFCPTTSHTVDIRYITFVRGENLENFKTYNWAKFGFANFKSGMFTTKGNKNIAADVHFLTVIYLWHVMTLRDVVMRGVYCITLPTIKLKITRMLQLPNTVRPARFLLMNLMMLKK
ncbi:hypothetical protein LINPERHAP1_LOCUS26650, partial [Linum perenne]